MADIRLLSLIPPAAIKTGSSTQGAEGGSLQALNRVEPTVQLSGFIINRDAKGNPVLRTDSGDITFSSPFFLKIGSEVVIRVEQNGGTGVQSARILSVDGKTPDIAAQQNALSAEPEIVLSQSFRPPNPLVSINASIRSDALSALPQAEEGIPAFGTLIKPPAAPAGSAPQTPTQAAAALPPGTQLSLRIVSVAPPTEPQGAVPAASTAPPQPVPVTVSGAFAAYAKASGSPVAATGAAPASAPAALPPVAQQPAALPNVPTPPGAAPTGTLLPQSLTAGAPLPPSSSATTPEIAATKVTGQPAAQPLPATPASPAPLASSPLPPTAQGVIQAVVIGHESTGEAVLQTPLGIVRLQPEALLAKGSVVLFRLVQSTPAPLSSLNIGLSSGQPISTQPAPILELAQQWASLQQILDLLASRPAAEGGGQPVALPSVLTGAQSSPLVGKDIGSGVLFFFSLLRGGNIRELLGEDNVKWLDVKGFGNLLKKAQGELNSLASHQAESRNQSWQSIFFPVAVDGMIQQLRLFVKKDREGGSQDAEQKSEDTRFILELNMSQLGEMQIDGFVRKGKDMQFDMVIRSLQPLPTPVQADIQAIYLATSELNGFKGTVAFQHVREFPVVPMQALTDAQNPPVKPMSA